MAINKIIPRTLEDLKQIEVNDMIEVDCRLFYMALNKEEKI